nr:MAP7 domain-containing protein 1-like [Ipomoea batatas]
MAHADMHARTVVDKWLVGLIGKQFLLDLGDADYGLGFQDAQKEIYKLLKARNATFSPISWCLPDPTTPDDASVDTNCDEISMDKAYMNSSANLDSVAGMHHDPVPTRIKDGQGDMVATKEEDPSTALQLNRRHSRSSDCDPPT